MVNLLLTLFYINIYKVIIIFISICSLLFTNFNDKHISRPKISIFLPIYNKSTYLKRSIGSIQNQSIKDIEIILVNDASEDNTLQILKEIAKKDSRIKIITNNINRGTLYSRAMGIINSKGEYLMNLDPDDSFTDARVLEYLYQKAKKNSKPDVISYGHLYKNSFTSLKSFICKKFRTVQFQPEIFKLGNEMRDFLITNKLIKREIFLKAYDFFKSRIFGEKWVYSEDEIWSVLINKYAKSKICTNKVAYIYYSNNDSLMHNRINIVSLHDLILWFEMLRAIYNKSEYKNYLLNHLFYLIELFKLNNRDNNLTDLIIKNDTLKKKYISVFEYIIINFNYSFNITFLMNILSSLKTRN